MKQGHLALSNIFALNQPYSSSTTIAERYLDAVILLLAVGADFGLLRTGCKGATNAGSESCLRGCRLSSFGASTVVDLSKLAADFLGFG